MSHCRQGQGQLLFHPLVVLGGHADELAGGHGAVRLLDDADAVDEPGVLALDRQPFQLQHLVRLERPLAVFRQQPHHGFDKRGGVLVAGKRGEVFLHLRDACLHGVVPALVHAVAQRDAHRAVGGGEGVALAVHFGAEQFVLGADNRGELPEDFRLHTFHLGG